MEAARIEHMRKLTKCFDLPVSVFLKIKPLIVRCITFGVNFNQRAFYCYYAVTECDSKTIANACAHAHAELHAHWKL
ncbi:hypothetical protein Xhom_00831 [Xenorhabdus hominickii]|uniref:Uncharacterized protein n=1 Tax=Xenorhabdus hominickii TaxID=351679 RepID=A0A2G0QF46_XENHO|nr:hypothetical protein Xhom_00831 [Xenorhabdus hominickii]